MNNVTNSNLSFFRVLLPCLGWCPKSFLCLLDKPQSKATHFIDNQNLTKSLQSLSHRRLVADLSIFYRHYHGRCSLEIRNIIPDPVRRVRTTRNSTHSRPLQVSLPNPLIYPTNLHSFQVPVNRWTSYFALFPSVRLYNLSVFKSNINNLTLSLFLLNLSFSSFVGAIAIGLRVFL